MPDERQLYVALADLLTYPHEGLSGAVERVRAIAADDPDRSGLREAASALAAALEAHGLQAMQEQYTATFDLDPVCSPYIGYHLFGEAYKRGALMSRLKEVYRDLALEPGDELPDHIAWILRFLAALDDRETYDDTLSLLVLPALDRMAKVFQETKDPYAEIIRSLHAHVKRCVPEVTRHA